MAKVEIGDIDFPRHQEYKLAKISRELFRLMLNNPKCDYATLEEMFGPFIKLLSTGFLPAFVVFLPNFYQP